MAGLLMAAGLLIGFLAGLCTLFAEISFIGSLFQSPRSIQAGQFSALLLPIMFGAFPILIGTGLFVLGRRLSRPAQRFRPPLSFK
jgi:hypothetical protein